MAENTATSTKAADAAVRSVDPLWSQLRDEAAALVAAEPALAGFVHATVLNQRQLEHAILHRLAQRLAHPDMDAVALLGTFKEVLEDSDDLGCIIRADLAAVYDRDPACHRVIEPVLYFKGFQALQAQRMAHRLWHGGREDFALYLQSQISAVFGADIHPATRIGQGVMIDHATGIVFGETAVIGDDCSILHDVTLGGTGKDEGDRHPKIGRGVLLSVGAKVLGNISVGDCSRVAAGSVVLEDVPSCKTVAGVPAKIVGDAGCPEPSRSMNHALPCS